jgi:hypothetical protein
MGKELGVRLVIIFDGFSDIAFFLDGLLALDSDGRTATRPYQNSIFAPVL